MSDDGWATNGVDSRGLDSAGCKSAHRIDITHRDWVADPVVGVDASTYEVIPLYWDVDSVH